MVWTVVLTVTVGGLTMVPAQAARGVPVVSAVSPRSGPVKPSVLIVKGRNLRGADAVKFGSKRGKLVRVISASRVRVRTPRGMRPGTVKIRIHTPAGWSKPRARARYTFVGKPALGRVSPAKGSYAGGQKVTLKGKRLAGVKKVRFGDSAAHILRRGNHRIVVRTPIGVLGAVKVTLKTRGGKSHGRTFTYVAPPRESDQTVKTAEGTFVPTAVDWVTGGPDQDEGTSDPWVVGLPSGAASPVIGQQIFIAPGSAAAPSGLAGTVDDVAVQVDESVRVTVSASDLDQALDQLSVDYSGPLLDSGAVGSRRGTETGVEWPIGGSALFCQDQDGNSVAFGADLTMRVSDVDVSQHLDLGGLFSRPSYDGTFTAEVTTTGKFHGEAASTCNLRPAWQNAHRRIIPLGTTGLTVSFAPAIEFSVTAKGTLTMLDRTRTTFALDAQLGKTPRFSKASRTIEHSIGGALTFGVSVAGGVSVQFGLLDRAGLQGKILLALTAELEASGHNVCVTGKTSLKLSVNVFFDAWVTRWESPSLGAEIDLYQFARFCLRAETSPPSTDEPQIVSDRLADAPIGAPYTATLQTADARSGTWSVGGYSLPAGLSLSPDTGAISGTPTGPVDDYPVIIDFQDADGRVATTTIRIQVLPEAGIGGGDIQVTLRWTGPADLDLHVIDPNNEEIYYGNPSSVSGGELDHDANAACNGPADDDNAVENVFWPPSGAPVGSYAARVVVYAVCDGALDWHLTVRRGGQVIIDQTSNGDSADFPFTVGAAPDGARPGPRDWANSYPAK